MDEASTDDCASYYGCIWFEDEVGWDMVIHGYWDKDIHDVCLVGWI